MLGIFREFEELSSSGGIFKSPHIIEMPPFTSSEPAAAANCVFLRKETLLETLII